MSGQGAGSQGSVALHDPNIRRPVGWKTELVSYNPAKGQFSASVSASKSKADASLRNKVEERIVNGRASFMMIFLFVLVGCCKALLEIVLNRGVQRLFGIKFLCLTPY